MVIAGEGADQHHQAALGQVEVGDQYVHQLELKARRDEDVGVATGNPSFCPAFQRADTGGAHGHDASAACLAGGNGRLGFGRHVVPLAVHLVLGQVLSFDRLEGACTHMQRHMRALHAHGVQLRKYALVKVQCSRGGRYGAGVFRKHGLVALHVFGRVAVRDVGGERHMAVALH